MLRKYRFIAFFLALLLCLPLFAACGQGAAENGPAGSTSGGEAPSDTTSGGGPVTINFIASSGGSGKSFAGTIDAFNKAYEGKIRVNGEYIAQESLLERILLQFVSGTASTDVIATLWQAQTNGYFEPLAPYLQRDGIDAKSLYGEYQVNICSVDGELRSLPVRTNTDVVFYRSDLFKEAGLKPPTNLEEYLACARALTVKDAAGNVTRYGTSLKMQSPAYTCQQFAYFLMPMGCYFLTEDLKHASPTLTSQACYDVLKTMKTIQDEGLCPEPLSFTYDDTVVALQTDRVAFTIELSSRATLMDKKDASNVIGLMDFASYPVQQVESQPPSTYCSVWSLGIDENSTNKDAAWEFIKWATSAEQQKFMALQFDNGPTVLSIYDDPEYQAVNKSAAASKDILMTSTIRTTFPVSAATEMENVVHEELQKFMLGQQDEKATGQNMYNRIEAVIAAKK
jgi:multiple sugar transport system substrate-binding protein